MRRLGVGALTLIGTAFLTAPTRGAAQDPSESAPAAAEQPAPSAPNIAPAPTEPVPQTSAATTVPATEPPGAPAAGGTAAEDELVAAELAKLGVTEDGGGTSQSTLTFSGFADFNLSTLLDSADSPWRGSAYERFPAFSIGNFNLYMNMNLTDTVRMFGEVRFTFLPNGSASATTGSATGDYVSTAAQDYADFWRPLKWGGIEIERVYVEWTAHRALIFRAGVFLTPYGIWNVDHGSTTVITPQRPFIIGQELFPERQTGIEVRGEFDVSAHHTLGYNATISNGMGPVSEYRDMDANKALGARAYWVYDKVGQLRVGTSAFYGSDTAAREVPGIASDGQHLRYSQQVSAQSDVLSLAADVQWRIGGLLLQTEVITQQRRFAERGRVGAASPLLGQYIAPIDKLSWGVYGLAGYRFDWFGVMPYAMLQSVDTNDPVNLILFSVWVWELGLNIRPIDSLVIKLNFEEGRFPDDSFIGMMPMRFGQFQIAWAF